jgi:hypothetical protein
MVENIATIAQLGGTVFTVVAFLFYLSKYQDKQIEAQVALAVALENLTRIVTNNSIVNTANSIKLQANTDATKVNTDHLN